MSDLGFDIPGFAEKAVKDSALLDSLFDVLAGSSRKKRQLVASIINEISTIDASVLLDRSDSLIEALDRPEAQTRWECLEALTNIAPLSDDCCSQALDGAESALFDEEHGLVRLAALRFLCAFGSSSKDWSLVVWPLIDEAIQCYHGDPEFQEMLIAVVSFSDSDLHDEVREQLKSRMKFDAENSKGALGKRAKLIISNLE